jgi:hypothetical protein
MFFKLPTRHLMFITIPNLKMPLTLPPDELFTSIDVLISSAKAYAATRGYAIVILRSKKNKKGTLYKVWLKCDRGGKYWARGITEELRVRLTETRYIEYPFSAIGKLNVLGDWVLVSYFK